MAGTELDVLVVGGGVVGAGTALDAVSRGLSTALVEQRDFASGTSSRSSKLVHGGLRYLEMFDFALVREALEEILFGPSRVADGTMNLVGALRRAMATTGYTELKEFQRIEVVVS